MIMRDKLDKFIIKERASFDELEVSEKLWSKIEADLKPEIQKADYNWLWKVAAVLFIGATLLLLMDKYTVNQTPQVAQYDGYNQELIDVESYYVQQISSKRVELEASLSETEKDEFIHELNDLDDMYALLKSDLSGNKNNNKLISAMIQNLQLRVEILNKQLNILERMNKGRTHENITI